MVFKLITATALVTVATPVVSQLFTSQQIENFAYVCVANTYYMKSKGLISGSQSSDLFAYYYPIIQTFHPEATEEQIRDELLTIVTDIDQTADNALLIDTYYLCREVAEDEGISN
jgi:hypothetical protein